MAIAGVAMVIAALYVVVMKTAEKLGGLISKLNEVPKGLPISRGRNA